MAGGLSGAGQEGHGREGARSPFPATPRMLSSAAEPAPLPPPVGDSEEISSLHVKFARLVQSAQAESSRTERGAAGSERAGGGAGGVRAKVRARVAAVARADAGADREFMGDLVRAIAALAERLDDVTTRMGHLERLVQDVVDRLSEDLVRVQAALGALDLPVPQEPSRRDTEPGRPRDADG